MDALSFQHCSHIQLGDDPRGFECAQACNHPSHCSTESEAEGSRANLSFAAKQVRHEEGIRRPEPGPLYMWSGACTKQLTAPVMDRSELDYIQEPQTPALQLYGTRSRFALVICPSIASFVLSIVCASFGK